MEATAAAVATTTEDGNIIIPPRFATKDLFGPKGYTIMGIVRVLSTYGPTDIRRLRVLLRVSEKTIRTHIRKMNKSGLHVVDVRGAANKCSVYSLLSYEREKNNG